MVIVGLFLMAVGFDVWYTVTALIGLALLWELKDYYLKRKDFGSLADTVKYDWPDVAAFAVGIIIVAAGHWVIK